MTDILSKKQIEFVVKSLSKINIAHGSVRSGKTVGVVFRFMQALDMCPGTKIYICGKTFDTAYRNVVRLIMESEEMAIFRPFCSWSGKTFYFKNKEVTLLGAKDTGAIGNFQGDTWDLCYCNEIALYPDNIIDMIQTRLSKPTSLCFADCNPSHPTHKIKQWIDRANSGDKNYYQLHFTLDDNPYVDDNYKSFVRDSLSGVFYKRMYLGLWCLAEGAIFDFFDYTTYTVDSPPRSADYWIASIDYGSVNPFCCLLIGVNTGHYTQEGMQMWVEKEYFWDPKSKGRQKVNSEFADDVRNFLEPYSIKQLYIDPSAEAFSLDLKRRGLRPVHANNDVYNGIQKMCADFRDGRILICRECKNLIREIESYVWDTKQAERGKDEPVKKDDHAIDALRYALASHKVTTYDPYKEQTRNTNYLNNRFQSKFS